MNKKLISSILALLMLASTVLVSCGDSGDAADVKNTTQANDTTEAVETVPEETGPKLELPEDIDLNGRTVNFAVQ